MEGEEREKGKKANVEEGGEEGMEREGSERWGPEEDLKEERGLRLVEGAHGAARDLKHLIPLVLSGFLQLDSFSEIAGIYYKHTRACREKFASGRREKERKRRASSALVES